MVRRWCLSTNKTMWGGATLMKWHGWVLHIPVGDEGELPVSDHSFGKVFHNGGDLDMEVAEHLVTAPTTY